MTSKEKWTLQELYENDFTIVQSDLAINGLRSKWLCDGCSMWVSQRTSRNNLKLMLCDSCCIERSKQEEVKLGV